MKKTLSRLSITSLCLVLVLFLSPAGFAQLSVEKIVSDARASAQQPCPVHGVQQWNPQQHPAYPVAPGQGVHGQGVHGQGMFGAAAMPHPQQYAGQQYAGQQYAQPNARQLGARQQGDQRVFYRPTPMKNFLTLLTAPRPYIAYDPYAGYPPFPGYVPPKTR